MNRSIYGTLLAVGSSWVRSVLLHLTLVTSYTCFLRLSFRRLWFSLLPFNTNLLKICFNKYECKHSHIFQVHSIRLCSHTLCKCYYESFNEIFSIQYHSEQITVYFSLFLLSSSMISLHGMTLPFPDQKANGRNFSWFDFTISTETTLCRTYQ